MSGRKAALCYDKMIIDIHALVQGSIRDRAVISQNVLWLKAPVFPEDVLMHQLPGVWCVQTSHSEDSKNEHIRTWRREAKRPRNITEHRAPERRARDQFLTLSELIEPVGQIVP